MSKFQVFATTRTGRKRIFTTFPEYLYSRPWKTNKKSFHIQWILVGLLFGLYDIPKTREKYVSLLYVYRTMGVICVSPLPTTMHLLATSGRILMNLFFRRHGHTRVLDVSYGSNQIYSNIRFQNISSWSDICNICPAFWTECDGNSSTSFFKNGLYEIKRQESTRLWTFLFCVVQNEIASPTACDQG